MKVLGILSVLISIISYCVGVSKDEAKALCDFSVSTNISAAHPEWKCTDGSPDTPPCLYTSPWYGLQCSASNNVYGFKMNEIGGQLPSTLGLLSLLTSLNLSQNGFTGTIPQSIGNLRLYTIDLTSNYFDGQLPEEIANYSSVKILNLADNQFSGTLPSAIGYLKNLADIKLNDNYFTGPVPSSFCILEYNLQPIKHLNISDNPLECYPKCLADYWISLDAGNIPVCKN